MKGDEERCLAAGTDFYISKPIDPDVLYDAIAKLTSTSANADYRLNVVSSLSSLGEVIDVDSARKLCSGNDQRLRHLAETLLEETQQLMDRIRQSKNEGNMEEFRRAVHTLKGSAMVFHAQGVVDLGARIGKSAAKQHFELLDELLRSFEGEVGKMTDALHRLVVSLPVE